jgi:hypothetical protein
MDRNEQLEHMVIRMRDFYTAETGLGRLPDWQTDRSIAPNGVPSVANENGILYRALALIQAKRAGATLDMVDLTMLSYAIIGLRRLDNGGLYNRQPHGDVPPVRSEAHDNYIGICIADYLLGNKYEAQCMVRHWWRNWFCFDNVKPGRFSFKQFRQPGEVSIYYHAAGWRSPFLFMVWFLVGVFLNGRDMKKSAEASRLTFMRLWLVDQVGVKGFVQRWLYKKVRGYWFKKLIQKFGGNGITPIMMAYGEEHPVGGFEKLVQYEV